MRGYKESASIILTARHMQKCVRSPSPVNFQYNYNLLGLKRQQAANAFPSSYVFPGGVIEPFDADSKWYNLFTAFGFNTNSYSSLIPDVKTRPMIFKQPPNELPREISLRISAIREAFEECGILLCRRSNDGATHSHWAQHIEMSKDDTYSWQKRVHNDAAEFYSLCKHFDCYPDLWALYEWSNWLTPTIFSTKRFDTVFYIACMQSTPKTLRETSEIADLKWDLAANFIFSAEVIHLPLPQQYEIARIAKFESIENLFDFVINRANKGVSLVFPIKMKLRDGNVFVMPGDSMYPKEMSLLEKQVIDKSDMTIKEFQDISPVKNRIEYYDSNVVKLCVHNFENEDGHLMPMQLEYNHATKNKKH